MKTRHTLDKEGWGDGPWQTEPDEGLAMYPPFICRMWRHPNHGMLNGYVGVPEGHVLFGHSYQEDIFSKIEVHGGLTFAGTVKDDDALIWWYGFDTHHVWDWAPGFQANMVGLRDKLRSRGEGETWPEMPDSLRERLYYRTWDYVEAETLNLMVQLSAIAGDNPHLVPLLPGHALNWQPGDASYLEVW